MDYRCPLCGYFLFKLSPDVPRDRGEGAAICRGKCRKLRTVRLRDGSLVGVVPHDARRSTAALAA